MKNESDVQVARGENKDDRKQMFDLIMLAFRKAQWREEADKKDMPKASERTTH